jgi:bifunctional UDP-N-acetylglucosamine pyrophosphorylase / glucosamine-1-phosphate N-acetyltransferase
VLSGDAPLIRPETIQGLLDFHLQKNAAMTVLTADLPDPTGYGRVVRKRSGSDEVKAIVEEKQTRPAERKIREINSGFYGIALKPFLANIDQLSTANPHGEFYLTDMAGILHREKAKVVAFKTGDAAEVLGGNTRADLVELDAWIRMAKCRRLMAEGVTIFYPETCVIDNDVEVGPDTTIEPFVQLRGNTRVGSECRIRSYTVITNCELGNGVTILPGCVMDDSRVLDRAILGPYSRLRPGAEVGEEAHVGNFVELKKMKLGKGSKANHLSYLGDAEIGERVNVGAGTITCNYDGVAKHKTVIEDGVFVGSDATLVAPIRLGKGSYIAAGSCITEDVAEDALALGRSRQVSKAGWAKAKREQCAAAAKHK